MRADGRHTGVIGKGTVNFRAEIVHIKRNRASKYGFDKHPLTNPCRIDVAAHRDYPATGICALYARESERCA